MDSEVEPRVPEVQPQNLAKHAMHITSDYLPLLFCFVKFETELFFFIEYNIPIITTTIIKTLSLKMIMSKSP